jgi:acetyltransferase-like isoleucine patch superfamily enzyme
MFGADVSIVGADHRFDLAGTPMIFSGRPDLPETVIEDDVWLGGRSILMAGITVGRGSIIAAGSVVTRDVPPYSIMAGVPARLLRKRFDSAADERKHDEMLDSADYVAEFAHPKY